MTGLAMRHTTASTILCRFVLVALILVVIAPPPGTYAEAGQDASWVSLGPPGPWYVTALAVVPNWPDPAVIVAIRTRQGNTFDVSPPGGGAKELVRTRDGGRTWEQLPVPFDDTRFLVPAFFDFAPTASGGRLLFLLLPDGLLRSADDGASWQTVLELATDEQARFASTPNYAQLTLSPTFAQDQLAFVVHDGRLYRTRDRGTSWEPVDVPTDRRLSEVQFSPDFAHDHLVWLAGASGDDLDSSVPLGIFVSRDGGTSWSASRQPLQNERGALPGVSNLTVSPTFAQDGTLFAVARGITAPAGCFRPSAQRQAVLIRSTDRGDSWEIVSSLAVGCGQLVRIGLSEAFATDGIALVALASAGPSPASSNCRVLRTDTGGEAWTTVAGPGSYQSCSEFHVMGSGPDLTALLFYGSSISWLRSPDSGLTWQGFGPRAGSSMSGLPQPIVTRGATAFLGQGEGIWAIGPAATTTNGRLPCPEEPVGGFGRVYAMPEVQRRLGCALEPERPVRVRIQHIEPGTPVSRVGYWTEDDNPVWFVVYDNGDSVGQRLKASTREGDQWPAGDVTLVDGITQRFEGGTMLWLPQSDGSHVILVLPAGRVMRFPD